MSNSISLEALQLAITALEMGLTEHEQYPHLLTVRDGVIQRFEVAMDVSRQLVIRILKEKFGLDDTQANNKTFIREAAKYSLIVDVEAWFGHLKARNDSSHTYDAEVAAQVFERVPLFLSDVRDLYFRLEQHVA